MTRENYMEICNGNAPAAEFCESWVALCHLLDDIVDRDQPVTDARLAAGVVSWTAQVLGNPFVQKHALMLFPHIVTAANSWVASNRMTTGGAQANEAGQYHKLVWLVAYLCHGNDLEKMDAVRRKFDTEEGGSHGTV